MLVLWYFVFGIALPFKTSSSPLDLTGSVRAKEDVKYSETFKRVEQAFLKSMGLKVRPRPRRGVRVPQYMKDLYHSDQNHPDWSSTNFRFNGKWTSINTVRAFHHEDDLPADQAAHSPGHSVIKFDLSTFPEHEAVQAAELRLYKRDSRKANDTQVRIKLYRILKPSSQSTELSTRLIDSKIVHAANDGWVSFDVRSAVQHWVENPTSNYGIQVKIVSREGNNVNISPREIISNTTYLDEDKWHEERPLLIAYSHDSKTHHHVRKKRSSQPGKKQKRPQYCRRFPLNVDFSDVGWNDWIVAPRNYHAFYCAGECPYPISKHLNGTNHAIVQNLMKTVDPKVPNVCCVPTTLSPISMLYMNQFDKVVLKKYNEMVVEGCGCR